MSFVAVRRAALAAVLVLGAAGLAFAAPAGADTKDKAVSPTEKVRQALDQAVTLDLADQPLSQALTKLREQTKINFVVDQTTIQMMGYQIDNMPVSAKLKDAKARTALRTILGPYNLGYAIIGDTVLISTDEMVMKRQMQQRVSIDLDKVDLAAALKQLSKETATNLLLDTRVTGKDSKATVTLQLDDVPLDTAIKLVAEAGGLKHVQVGNVLLVTTKTLATEMKNDPELMQGGAQSAQQEMQMMQQRRMMMIQQQMQVAPIFQPVVPQPGAAPPAVDKTADKPDDKPADDKKADPAPEKKIDKDDKP
jgi:hypothetical protein